jgi:putative IMPACT (imprinted ancient) family translation regulator
MMSLEEAVQVAVDLEYRSREDIEEAIKVINGFDDLESQEFKLTLELKLMCIEMNEEVNITKKGEEGS